MSGVFFLVSELGVPAPNVEVGAEGPSLLPGFALGTPPPPHAQLPL